LQDYQAVASYITDELNCLELKVDSNEDEYVLYSCEPDNKLIGQALKKAYDKKLKEEIAGLSSAKLRDYLKQGYAMHGDLKIEQGWLRVEKTFNDKYAKSDEYACASNMTSSVLLRTTLDDKLVQMGLAREITNRI